MTRAELDDAAIKLMGQAVNGLKKVNTKAKRARLLTAIGLAVEVPTVNKAQATELLAGAKEAYTTWKNANKK